jgi:hypothetical protein
MAAPGMTEIVMPDMHKDQSDAIKAKVKSKTESKASVEAGLKAWEKSLKKAASEGSLDQALVNHWRALKYLHKMQLKVTEGKAEEGGKRRKKKPSPRTEGSGEAGEASGAPASAEDIIKTIAASQTLLTRQSPALRAPPRPESPAHSSSSATSSSKRSATPAPSAAAPSSSASSHTKESSRSASPAPHSPSKSRSSSTGSSRPHTTIISTSTFSANDPLDKILEGDGRPVKHQKIGAEFENWGHTIKNAPHITFEPVSRVGVANIIKWAAANNKSVRAAGYRHTWSGLYGTQDQVLVSMIPVDQATHKVISPKPPVVPYADDLEGITFLREDPDGEHAYVRVGASTTNDQFRVWTLKDYKWSLPMSVDLVEITFGGAITPMCHGTGINHPTMADLVTEVEFINVKGDLQLVTDPKLIRAAAGSFGLLGIVTAFVIRVERMSYAAMRPTKIPAMLGIPPPPGWDVPKELQCHPSDAQLKGAQKTFEYQCANDFYNEWFWFPFQEKIFVNCWHNNGDKSKSKVMSDCTALLQNVQGILGSVANSVTSLIPGNGGLQTRFVSWSAMQVLPDLTHAKEPEVTPVIEAFYFRRGLHNMPMLDMELIIPIPARKDNPEKPDWTVINRAWWGCINKVYEYAKKDKYPLRLGLAMHIMHSSDMLMAAQNGNMVDHGKHRTFGSCSINISTIPQTPPELWLEFCQEIADVWHDFYHPDGTPLNVRAHWVKEWQGLKYKGVPLVEHYRTVAYKDRIPEFLSALRKIAHAGDCKVKELRKRFSNPLLDSLFWHDEK